MIRTGMQSLEFSLFSLHPLSLGKLIPHLEQPSNSHMTLVQNSLHSFQSIHLLPLWHLLSVQSDTSEVFAQPSSKPFLPALWSLLSVWTTVWVSAQARNGDSFPSLLCIIHRFDFLSISTSPPLSACFRPPPPPAQRLTTSWLVSLWSLVHSAISSLLKTSGRSCHFPISILHGLLVSLGIRAQVWLRPMRLE